MIEKNRKRKKSKISEEDISFLLPRYSAMTLLALLQEVAQFEGSKIDWNALVKKTKTGISNPREYRMLWRHLAYRHALLDKHNLEDGVQQMEDDSDLECELEVFPDASCEALTEAAACVKVLMGSGLPSDPSHPNSATVEAPLTINIPNGQSFRAGNSQPSSMRGINITVPVSVQKLPLPVGTGTEGLDASGSASGNIPPRRRRKPWTEKEDMILIDLVQKYGEGNWAAITKHESMRDRTAPQLAQRWAILKKKQMNNLNVGASPSGSQPSEAWRAARHAINVALDLPVKITGAVGASSSNTSINPAPPATTVEASTAQHQPQQFPAMAKSSPSGPLPLASGARSQASLQKTSAKSDLSLDPGRPAEPAAPSKKTSAISDLSSDPAKAAAVAAPLKKTSAISDMSLDPVRAAAVAAGARIATQSDAASLFKAAQAKNAIHIMPKGGSSIKSSIPGGLPAHSESYPNVRYMSTGLTVAPLSSHPATSSSGSHSVLVKASSPTTQCAISTPAALLNVSSEKNNSELCSKVDAEAGRGIKVSDQTNSELHPRVSAETEMGIKVSGHTNGGFLLKLDPETEGGIKLSGPETVAEIKEDGDCVSGNEPNVYVQAENAALTIKEAEFKSEVAATGCSNTPLILKMADVIGNHAEVNQHANDMSPLKGCDNKFVVQENCKSPSLQHKQADLQTIGADECNDQPENMSGAEPGDGMQK